MSSPIRSLGRGHKRRASERSNVADQQAESSASGSRRDAIAKGRQARNSLADIFDDEQDAEGEEDDLARPPHATEVGDDTTSPKRKRTIRLTTRPRKISPSAETPRPPAFSEEPEETPEAKQAAQLEKEEAEMQTRWMEEHFEIVEQLPLEIHRMFALIGELEGQTHARLKNVSQNTIKYRDARIALNKVLQSSAKKSTENTDGISESKDVDGATPPIYHTQRKDLLRTISHAADECVKGAEEKMDLAITAYNLIDRHIRRLDGDISKMEASILLGLRSGTEESRGVRDALGLPNDVGEEEIVEAVDPNSKLGRKGMSTQAETASLTKSAGAARNRNSRASTSATANKSRSRAGTVTTETPKEPSIVSGMAYDPTEPTYCYCDQVSVDEMVACENDDCKLEWFHYACVGLTSAPKGKWFCRFCAPPTWKGPGMAVPPNAKFKPPDWKKGGIKS